MFANILWAASLPETEQLSWDIMKQIVQSQYNLAAYGLMAVIAVAVLVAGGSWVTTFYLSRREVRRIIESLRSEMRSAREEDFAELEKRIKEEIDKLKKMVEEDTKDKIELFDAEKARLFALSGQNAQLWSRAAYWWAKAIKRYTELNQDELVRVSVDGVIKNLNKCERLKDADKKDIEKYISFIPNILEKEKEKIEAKLAELSKSHKLKGK